MSLKRKFYVVPTRIGPENQHEIIVFKRNNILFLPSYGEAAESTILESFKSFFEKVLHNPEFSIRKGCVLPNHSNISFYYGSFRNKFLAVISNNPEYVETVEYIKSDFFETKKNGVEIEETTLSILLCYFGQKHP